MYGASLIAAALALLFACGLGFGMGRARLCLVTATHDFVFAADPGGLRLQALAICAMAFLFGSELMLGMHRLPLPMAGAGVGLVPVGAALLAIGFILNDGCYLGSVSFLGQGKLRYLFTLIGIYLAELISVPRRLMFIERESLVPQMSIPPLATAAAVFAVLAWVALGPKANAGGSQRMWGVIIASVSALLMFSILPGWSYGATIAGLARSGVLDLGLPQLAGVTLFLGAIIASVTSGQWRLELPGLSGVVRCLSGGYIMQTGAQIVPGGTDTWLFWTIPGGGLHGVIAYAVVVPITIAWWWIHRSLTRVRAVGA